MAEDVCALPYEAPWEQAAGTWFTPDLVLDLRKTAHSILGVGSSTTPAANPPKIDNGGNIMPEDKETKESITEETKTAEVASVADAADDTVSASEDATGDSAPATKPEIDMEAFTAKMSALDEKLNKIERTIGLFVESGATIRESGAEPVQSSSGMYEDDVYLTLEDLDYNL